MRFIQRTKQIFNPVFPPAYALRKSEIGLDNMISKEKERLKVLRLRAIRKEVIEIMKAL